MSDLDDLNDICRDTLLEAHGSQFTGQVSSALLEGIFKVLVLIAKIYIGKGK